MADPRALASRLFQDVMAPMVLGGPVRPGHAIGARAAQELAPAADAIDAELADSVQTGRVRRARRLAPIDSLEPASAAEWVLMAALHDVLQSTNPSFDSPLRRGAAARILDLALQTLERVPPAAHVGEALSRHSWLARLFELSRTDTDVSWWTGSRTFRGVAPPARLQAWPELRRVTVVATPRPLLELTPLAVDRDKLVGAVARMLERSPLTDLATCTRAAPAFAWQRTTMALVATRAGRTLVLRSLQRLSGAEVDTVLGKATRALLAGKGASSEPALALLGERALAAAQGASASSSPSNPEAEFARGLGAVCATHLLGERGWPEAERARLLAALGPVSASPAAREASALLPADP